MFVNLHGTLVQKYGFFSPKNIMEYNSGPQVAACCPLPAHKPPICGP